MLWNSLRAFMQQFIFQYHQEKPMLSSAETLARAVWPYTFMN